MKVTNAVTVQYAIRIDMLKSCNSKSVAIANLVGFFCNSPFVSQEPCDQDRTCFLGHTGRYFVDGLFIVTRRVWPITCDVILRKISNDEEINIWVLSMFHDTNSTLCKVISNHRNAGFRLKVINIFLSVNLTLSRKGQQTARNAETRWNMTEDSRVKRSLF